MGVTYSYNKPSEPKKRVKTIKILGVNIHKFLHTEVHIWIEFRVPKAT